MSHSRKSSAGTESTPDSFSTASLLLRLKILGIAPWLNKKKSEHSKQETNSTIEMILDSTSDEFDSHQFESKSNTPREDYMNHENLIHRSKSDSELLKDYEGNIIHSKFKV